MAKLPEGAEAAEADAEQVPVMSNYQHEWSLDLPRLAAPSYQDRNLCVQMQRSTEGNYRAVLVDLGEFRGSGSTQGLAIDDLINELKHVASEIRRASTVEGLREGRL